MIDCKIDLSRYKGKLREAISAAIQEKLFQAGKKWMFGKLRGSHHTSEPYLVVRGREITYSQVPNFTLGNPVPLISAEDFLEGWFPVPEVKVRASVVNEPYHEVVLKDGDSVTVRNVGGAPQTELRLAEPPMTVTEVLVNRAKAKPWPFDTF